MSVKVAGYPGELYDTASLGTNDKIAEFDTLYNNAYYAWNPLFPEADLDLRFFLGDQWRTREQSLLHNEGRSAFVFNRVRRAINLVTGYQRKNRLASVVVPMEDTDQKVADQLTKLLMHSMQLSDGYRFVSDAFGGALKTGWNMLSLWMDYRNDPVNGDIKLTREPYNAFILDPYFTQLDLSDCDYMLRRKYLGLEQAISLLPKHKAKLEDLYEVGWSRDDKFTWLPYQQQPNGQVLMAYNEMYRQKWRDVPVLVDMETGLSLDWEGPRDRLKMILDMKPSLKMVKRSKRYIEMSVIVNDELIETIENPYGLDEYPFVPFVAIFEPESENYELKVQSLIRCMRDPQTESNRRRSQMIDILDSQINSGWIATENSVINPHSLFQSSQGRVIWRREDAQPGAIEKIPPAQIPPSMFQLQELFDKDITEISGVNDAAFGVPDSGNESGVMMMLRQGAAVVNLQDLFDNLRFSQKCLGKKMVKLMQKWTPHKMMRIIGEEPDPKIYEGDLVKYDIDVTEGVLTENQKQMYFRQLLDLKQLGVPVSGAMLAEAAPIQGKTKFIEQLAQEEKAQAEQAKQVQQMQQVMLSSQVSSNEARSTSDLALAKEREARAIANLGLQEERNAKSIQDRTQSTLDRVKAMKELESMDTSRLLQYMSLIQALEAETHHEEMVDKAEDSAIVARAGNAPRPSAPLTPGGQMGGNFNEEAEQSIPNG